MKVHINKIAITILVGCFLSAINAQINLKSDYITFRTYNTADNGTTHYGDLTLSGGSTGSGWGWLTTQAVRCYGWMDVYGDLHVYGNKNFIQPHPTDTTKIIKYIAIESGEALTIARGTSKTINGNVTIQLPEHFSLVTSDEAPITVLITPENAPVLLFVKDKSKENIVISMKEADFFEYHDVEFSFQVTGVRDGFEDETVIDDIADVISEENISNKRKAYNEKVKVIADKMKKVNRKNNK